MSAKLRQQSQSLARALVAALVCLSILLSTACIVAFAHHDCVGEGCETCAVLELSAAQLTRPSTPSASIIILQLQLLFVCTIVLSRSTRLGSTTPVGLKVRLDS